MAAKRRNLELGFILFLALIRNAQGSCTASGGDLDGPCIFPWKETRYGPWFNECADPDNSGRLWCGTKLYGRFHWKGVVEKWGYCDSNCFTTITATSKYHNNYNHYY